MELKSFVWILCGLFGVMISRLTHEEQISMLDLLIAMFLGPLTLIGGIFIWLSEIKI